MSLLDIIRRGYASLFQAYNEITPGSIGSSIDDIVRNIEYNPRHFIDYIQMLTLTVPYLDDPKKRRILRRHQRNVYEFFQAVYSGNLDTVTRLYPELRIIFLHWDHLSYILP